MHKVTHPYTKIYNMHRNTQTRRYRMQFPFTYTHGVIPKEYIHYVQADME